jgi:hypothetical protein
MFGHRVRVEVKPLSEGAWLIVEGENQLSRFRRKRDATLAARNYLKSHGGGDLVVHSVSGRLTECDHVPQSK